MLPFNLVAAVVVKKANIVYLSTQAVLDQLLTPYNCQGQGQDLQGQGQGLTFLVFTWTHTLEQEPVGYSDVHRVPKKLCKIVFVTTLSNVYQL